ncbi:MAG: hypothetical protein Q7S55_05250 [Nanoarchaeota archaeon]|nr:hypothetical protein [Nanoarchaeota archaeon]
MDKDVQSFLLFMFFVFGFMVLNDKYWKYKTGWRYWVGVILCSLGISGFIIDLRNVNFITILASLTYIVPGSAIWLIKAEKMKKG